MVLGGKGEGPLGIWKERTIASCLQFRGGPPGPRGSISNQEIFKSVHQDLDFPIEKTIYVWNVFMIRWWLRRRTRQIFGTFFCPWDHFGGVVGSFFNQKWDWNCLFQSNMHDLFFLDCFGGDKTARIASSNICLRPFWVNAEHSRYFDAPTSFANDRPYLNWKLHFNSVWKYWWMTYWSKP